MEEYNFGEIERHWQSEWAREEVYKVAVEADRPKYYVLDMFPYPSGAGLHVGHPLGYIASDIYSRYKRLRGYNVLHPMGYDAFGLPAEQYAIQTGQHPAETTRANVERYRGQLQRLGLSYDWSREVRTCNPDYYRWTQWVFLQLFDCYYDAKQQKARRIADLEAHFAKHGSEGITAYGDEVKPFSASEWAAMDSAAREGVLQHFRLAYRAETMVNWCPELGTVLANDEVKEGFSVRGGHPVEQRRMMQWCLRVSAYAERLLAGLEGLEWSDALKTMQRNWIGRSEGARVFFPIDGAPEEHIEVFTTRPDTIYGVTFLVLAPEHELVRRLITTEQREAMEQYLERVSHRSERERQAEARHVTGVFTGSYAVHPLTGERVPIWVGEYVLVGYGTGAIMAVPAHDGRDFAFARHFGLEVRQVVAAVGETASDVSEWTEAYEAKEGVAVNSPLFEGLPTGEAIVRAIEVLAARGVGTARVTYRLRDAIFSRQRYWGEPIPIYYKDGVPCALDAAALPLQLPEVDAFLPTDSGEPPLARAKGWSTPEGYPLETSTMPGFAGSSAYYLRFMDPHCDHALVSREANAYWQDVDLYVGGTEHATGHLIYSRFWNKFLYDLGYICRDEPFRKLVNQGMIQGRSSFLYRVKGTNRYVPAGQKDQYDTMAIHVDIKYVHNDTLDIEALRAALPEYHSAEFVLEDGRYECGWAVEKMSKSFFNVVNPDSIIERYGADTLRMYEMFLGPLEQSKPWDTQGIDGVYKFLRRLWSHYTSAPVVEGAPAEEALRTLHRTIKAVEEGIERFGFNLCVSSFMVCLNELTQQGARERAILEPLLVILAPFAPHVCEELWHRLGHSDSVVRAQWPAWDARYVEESDFECPVSFNGKTRFTLRLAKGMAREAVERAVLEAEETKRFLGDKQVKKIIVVPNRIVNIVI